MKIGQKLLASFFCISSLLAYEGQGNNSKACEVYEGGFTTGTLFDASRGDPEFYWTVGYINSWFLFDFGVNYQHINLEVIQDQNTVGFLFHLGIRNHLLENTYLTYGIVGGTEAISPSPTYYPFSAGAFLGFDVQIAKSFLLSFKANALYFERTYTNVKTWNVFESGSIGSSFVF